MQRWSNRHKDQLLMIRPVCTTAVTLGVPRASATALSCSSRDATRPVRYTVPASARTSMPSASAPMPVFSEARTSLATVPGTGTGTTTSLGPGVSMETGLVVQAASETAAAIRATPSKDLVCMEKLLLTVERTGLSQHAGGAQVISDAT